MHTSFYNNCNILHGTPTPEAKESMSRVNRKSLHLTLTLWNILGIIVFYCDNGIKWIFQTTSVKYCTSQDPPVRIYSSNSIRSRSSQRTHWWKSNITFLSCFIGWMRFTLGIRKLWTVLDFKVRASYLFYVQ